MTIKHVPVILLAAGVLAAAPACAPSYGYGGYHDGREIGRVAYDNGFREGTEQGRNDIRRGRSFDYDRHDEYRDADDGYSRSYGNKDEYRRVFRQGFVAGYNEAYRGNAGYGSRTPVYQPPVYQPPVYQPPVYQTIPPAPGVAVPRGTVYVSVAADNGYRDGLKQGRDDLHGHRRYDPVSASRYREGDHDYKDRYGSREDYKRDYRVAFERGYAEGWRQP